MTTPRDIFQTVMAWLVVCPLQPIFGRVPSEEEAADFLSKMLQVLSGREMMPDAAGYRADNAEIYFAYKGLIQAADVREAIYEAYVEAQNQAAREERRKKMLHEQYKRMNENRPYRKDEFPT